MTSLIFQKPLEDYIAWYERLTPRSLRLLEKLAAPEIRFIDPFNDVRGVEAVIAVLEKMFTDTDRPKFTVSDYAWGRDGYTAYLRWTFMFLSKGKNREFVIEGLSEVVFGPDGKIVQHHDHWDSGSQLMAKLPVIGWTWKILRKKLAL